MKRVFLLFSVLIFSVFLISNNSMAQDLGNNPENNVSSKIEKIKPDKDKKTDFSKSSIEDIFGDEQTFPFVAGLGKNAAH